MTISITLNLSDCTFDRMDYFDKSYRIKGECDTSRCKAVCCQIMNWKGKVGERCEFLLDDYRCMFHAQDIHCKPVSCLMWPVKPLDIEKVNEIAERLGFKERCHLEVVPWQQ